MDLQIVLPIVIRSRSCFIVPERMFTLDELFDCGKKNNNSLVHRIASQYKMSLYCKYIVSLKTSKSQLLIAVRRVTILFEIYKRNSLYTKLKRLTIYGSLREIRDFVSACYFLVYKYFLLLISM